MSNIEHYLDQIEGQYLASKKRQRSYSTKAKSDPAMIDIGAAASMHLFEDLYPSNLFNLSGTEVVELITKYPSVVQTDFRLEKSFCAFLRRRLNIEVDQNQIATFRGAYGSFVPIISTFAERHLIVPSNIHQIHKAHFAAHGFMLHEVPSDEHGLLDVDALERILQTGANVRWIYVNHNRGTAPTSEYLERLATLLETQDVYALYDADVLFTHHTESAQPWLPLMTPAFKKRAIVVCNMTKEVGLPGLRVGFGVGSQELIARVRNYQKMTLEMMPPIVRHLARKVLDNDAILEAADILQKRMRYLKQQFADLGWPVHEEPEGGVNLFLNVPPAFEKAKIHAPDELFCFYMVQQIKALVRPGSTYGYQSKNQFRTVVCQPLDVMEVFFNRLKEHGVHYDMALPDGLEAAYTETVSQ